MSDALKREEARKLIEGIKTRQLKLIERGDEHAARFEQLGQKVDDVLKAQRLMTERSFKDPTPHGGNTKLRRYVRADTPEAMKGFRSWQRAKKGSLRMEGVKVMPIRLLPETVSKRIPGHDGPVLIVQHGLLSDPRPADAWQLDLQKMVSTRNLARWAQKLSGNDPHTPHLDADILSHLGFCPDVGLRSALDAYVKAFYDGTNVGAEWIPDQFIPDLYREFMVPRGLRALLKVVQVTGNTVLRPKITTGSRPYIKGQIQSDDPRKYTPSTPVTDQASISLSGLAVLNYVDDAALEDSAIVASSVLRGELIAALDDGFEDYMINGDTGTHQDAIGSWNTRSRWGASGLGGDADHRRYGIGWRARAFDLSNTTDVSGSMTVANYSAVKADLGERGVSDLITVTSPEAFVVDFLTMSEALTIDVAGNGATFQTGQLARVMGDPLHISRFVTSDLASTGLYTGSGTTTSSITVNKSDFQRYSRRGALVEVDKDITSGTVAMVATVREVMDTPASSTSSNVAVAINL